MLHLEQVLASEGFKSDVVDAKPSTESTYNLCKDKISVPEGNFASPVGVQFYPFFNRRILMSP